MKKIFLLVVGYIFVQLSLTANENVLFYTSFQSHEGWVTGGAASASAEWGGEKTVSISDVVYSNKTLELKLYRVGIEADNNGKCSTWEGQLGRAQIQKDNKPYASTDFTFQSEPYTGYIMFPPFDVDVVVSWTCDASTNLDRAGYVATADWVLSGDNKLAPNGLNNALWTTEHANLAPAVNSGNCVSFTTPVKIPAGKFIQIRSHTSGGGIYFRTLKISKDVPDIIPPVFQNSLPESGAVGVLVESTRSISLAFSEFIQSNNASVAHLYDLSIGVGEDEELIPTLTFNPDDFKSSGSAVTLNFPVDFILKNGVSYELHIAQDAVTDLAGNPMSEDLVISFTTAEMKVVYENKMVVFESFEGEKTFQKIKDVARINFNNGNSNFGTVNIELKDGSKIEKDANEVKRMYLFDPADYSYTKTYVDAIHTGKTNGSYVRSEARVLDSIKGFQQPETLPAFKKYGRDESRKFTSTGFFRTEKIEGRWWIIDPDGYPVYLRGICELNRPSGTGPNAIFPQGNPKYQAYNSLYGSSSVWMRAAVDSLNRLGIGHAGLGGATSEMINYNSAMSAQGRAISYTVKIDFMTEYLKTLSPPLAKKSESRTFNPDFVAYCDARAKSIITSSLVNDRNLYGYYSDNELMFGMESLERYLKISNANDPSRIAVENWMVDNGYTRQGINNRIRAEFAAYEADYYYQIVTAAIRKYDQNHLFLGSRLHSPSRLIPEIIRVENEYSDVCSINYYNEFTPLESTLKIWLDNLPDKPFHVTEFYSKAYNTGIWGVEGVAPFFTNGSGVGVITKNQRDRSVFYENYTLRLLENKQCVGFDLYKYTDDDSTDNTGNGISNKGLFSNILKGWQPYSNSVQKINRNVYELIEFFDKQP